MRPGVIRRCLNCNHKTHHRYWESDSCPICGMGVGFLLSLHGGLTKREINEKRKQWQRREKRLVA